jgi:hypothetical protein
MLRTNLSTRPFYNERAVHLAIAGFALVVLGITAWNVISVLNLSRLNTELSSHVNRDHEEAARLTAMATDIRGRINQAELQRVVNAAREANTLIDQRTFSWTAFFNRLETTMPPDVMLAAVRPEIDEGVTRVTMQLLARRAEDVDEFFERLEATGAFEDVVPTRQDRTEDGLYRVTVESVYTGSAAETDEAEKPGDKPGVKPGDTPAAGAPAGGAPVKQAGGTR